MKTVGIAMFAWFAFIITLIAGWITHVVVCIQQQEWILLAVGAIIAPVGTIHGIGHWFGAFGGH